MNQILVLCIGNICRSPMAEGLLRRALPDHVVLSCGLGALIGNPADPLSVELMMENGIDITTHRAQQISAALVSQSDLILVMDTEQKKYIETQYVGARGKVFRMGEAAGIDIPDPYLQTIEKFRQVYHLIEDGAKFWASQIDRMS